VISTDGTVVDNDVPRPQGHSIPLFNFKTSLAAIFAFLLTFVLHLNLLHPCTLDLFY